MPITNAIVPIHKSKYNKTHFKQLVSTFEKEYSFYKFTIDEYGVVQCIIDKTVTGMYVKEVIGKFFYTSSGDLYFYNTRSLLLPKTMPGGFFRVDRTHRMIIDFMLHFKFKRLISLIAKRMDSRVDTNKTFMEAEELYRVYWVKQHDKS